MSSAQLPFEQDTRSGEDNLPSLENPEDYFEDLEKIEKELGDPEKAVEKLAEDMAYAICQGFQLHDEGSYEDAEKCFAYVDINQFPEVDEGKAAEAAHCYNEALELKDDIESDYSPDEKDVEEVTPEDLDRDSLYEDERWKMRDLELQDAQYTDSEFEPETIQGYFTKRAWLASEQTDWGSEQRLKAAEEYGEKYMEFWRRHKLQEQDSHPNDYSQPLLDGMRTMAGIITGDRDYPEDKISGKGGPGELPFIYLTGAEAHDKNQWRMIPKVMKIYYSSILSEARDQYRD